MKIRTQVSEMTIERNYLGHRIATAKDKSYSWDNVYAEGLKKLNVHYGTDMEKIISQLK
jgi:hypothetical protein